MEVNKDEDTAKWLAIAVGAVILGTVFIVSPVGDVFSTVIGWIPGMVWGWVVGLAAFVGLLALIRYAVSQM